MQQGVFILLDSFFFFTDRSYSALHTPDIFVLFIICQRHSKQRDKSAIFQQFLIFARI